MKKPKPEDTTTIVLKKSTMERLSKLKIYKRETMEDLLTRILDELEHEKELIEGGE